MYAHIYTHINIYMHMNTYMYIYKYIYIYIYICVYVYIYVHKLTHVHVYYHLFDVSTFSGDFSRNSTMPKTRRHILFPEYDILDTYIYT